MKQSDLEARFSTRYLQVGRHSLVPEYIFDKPEDGRKKRMWRFDFANTEAKVGVELDGGEWSNGRHVTGQGFIDDCEKMNTATMQGWSVLRFPGSVFKDDPAGCIDMVDSLIDVRLPDTEAKEGSDIKLVEPIEVAAVEPEVVAVDVAVVVDVPAEQPEAKPEIKLLPAHLPHPYKGADKLFIIGHGQHAYEVKATGWLAGKPTVTLNIGTGDAINWTVFASRVSKTDPYKRVIKKELVA